jgi:hypothetical protein
MNTFMMTLVLGSVGVVLSGMWMGPNVGPMWVKFGLKVVTVGSVGLWLVSKLS